MPFVAEAARLAATRLVVGGAALAPRRVVTAVTAATGGRCAVVVMTGGMVVVVVVVGGVVVVVVAGGVVVVVVTVVVSVHVGGSAVASTSPFDVTAITWISATSVSPTGSTKLLEPSDLSVATRTPALYTCRSEFAATSAEIRTMPFAT